MKQSHGTSLLKSVVSTAVGFTISFGAQLLFLPMLGVAINLAQNTTFAIIMTVISIARGYLLERAFEAMGWRTRMSAFAIAVLAERQRQITHEGWTAEHDDTLDQGELASAAAAYAGCAGVNADENAAPPRGWPWPGSLWKPYSFRRDMVKAGALILAEGERFDRQRKLRRPVGARSEPQLEEGRMHV